MKRAYYDSSVRDFEATDREQVLGALAARHGFALDTQQRNAWLGQIDHLQAVLKDLDGHLIFELSIPRMGKRADVVLLHRGIVFVVEYKVGATEYDRSAVLQVVDYALDLKNFHAGSHALPIVPIVLATDAPDRATLPNWSDDSIAAPAFANRETFRGVLEAFAVAERPDIDPHAWLESGYKPTPTIVEAAKVLYQGHAVEEISRSDAGAINLTRTAGSIARYIEAAKSKKQKHVIFVTGVPGSGKTLAGLNIATDRMRAHEDEHAVFLSGNGPLVTVLREALARDDVARAAERGCPLTKRAAHQRASTFIQNIHHFRDDSLISEKPPAEKVVVFDEAQRAWTEKQASQFMKAKRGQTDFNMSEPRFLLSVMDRHEDWCVVICLIGGGQEINTGEAGLGEWFRAIAEQFPHWKVAHSDNLTGPEYAWDDLSTPLKAIGAMTDPNLHLGISIRSFRAECVSDFVSSIIEGDAAAARRHLGSLSRYPIVLTRNLESTRRWLRAQARGTERIGLVASSNALRLKPEGIHVKLRIDAEHWFLDGAQDVRSSYALEDVASEFDIQGLELDWVGVCWDANFLRDSNDWRLRKFVGNKWQAVRNEYAQIYLRNAYRVLLTRARQGMVIFVPLGEELDPTRKPEFYDSIAAFLTQCGVESID